MCLINDPESVKEVQGLEGDTITCYKVLLKMYLDNKVQLHSMYYYGNEYKAGTNVSNTSPTARCAKTEKNIYQGIHVYRTIETAQFCKAGVKNRCIVELTASKKDLLGANETEMVFRKVTLSEKEYNKHTKTRKKTKV